jgi:acetoin:2,6-dichlorophenolindophenol oxidoreductase subunit alpha
VDTVETLVAGLGAMWRIRLFEDAVQALFLQNLVSGSTHLCQGQEAVSVGACGVLRPGDAMTCTYRGHGAVIAMGAPLDACFAEIMGRSLGLCGGKGGSMHLADVERGALGSFAVVGAGLPVAVGAALTAQVRGTRGVAMTFFGDGSTNIGAFHESLNLAAVWKLPCVFVCENNLYGEYSPIASTTPVADIAARAGSYAMPGVVVDGNDLEAVAAAAGTAVDLGRSGGGPTLIEAKTYRQVGHSRSDPGAYRPSGELERWKEHDPLTIAERRLVELGVEADAIERIRADARRDVEDARDRALASPVPALDSRFTDILA